MDKNNSIWMFKMLKHYINQVRSANLGQFNNLLKNNSYLILVLATYLIMGIILLPPYQYVINADGFSYVTIAQKYAHGDFNNAINGLWSPLISWLLSLLLLFDSSPEYSVYAFKILSLTIGLFTIIGIHLLSFRFELNIRIRKLILISSIPMVLFISLTKTTPDLLVLTFLLYYLYILFDSKYSDNILNGILCGVLGALGYFTKSYIFIFFPVHFILINLYNYLKIKENRSKILKNMLIGLTIFFIISSIWVGVISNKYGYFTTGTAAKYNYDLVGPNSQWHPMLYQGLFKPPNKSALSAWEDPTYHKMEPWNPFSSWNYFKYQLLVILDNSILFMWILILFSALSIPILLISFIYHIKKSNIRSDQIIVYSLLTILIYSIGFFPIIFELRYLLIDFVLLFLLGGYLLTMYYKENSKNRPVINLLIIILMISFIITPIMSLDDYFDQNKDLYDLTQTLKNDYNIKGNIAATEGFTGWEGSFFISYYLNSQYYGETYKSNPEDLKKELKENNIKYYLVWDRQDSKHIQLPFKEIIHGSISYPTGKVYLIVYSID